MLSPYECNPVVARVLASLLMTVVSAAMWFAAPTEIVSRDSLQTSVPVVGDDVRECQALGPAAPYPIWAVDSARGQGAEVGWDARGLTDWQSFAQGEYVGHARAPHVPVYRLRPGDRVSFYYRRTREEIGRAYELQVGDVIHIESLTAGSGNAPPSPEAGQTNAPEGSIARDLVIQPDGTISPPLVGQVRAAGKSVASLRAELEEQYKEFYRVPAITVTPVAVNTRLNDLLEAVDARGGVGGLQFEVVVTPSGTVMLPALGAVFVQGLTPEEVKWEIDARYDATVPGVEVTPVVTERAPRFVYVLGEVDQPGQFELTGPTTVMQAIAMAGGWNLGANLRQVVVFRRGEDWRLMASMLDLKGALYARRPVPADDIWVNDSDIVLVPKNPIQQFDEFIDQVFTRGIYGVVPVEKIWGINFASTTSLGSN